MTYYCINCWRKIERDSLICPHCGYDLKETSEISFTDKLIRALDHHEPETPIRAADILGELGVNQAVPVLLLKLKSEKDPFIIKAFVTAILKIDPTQISEIQNIFGDNPPITIKKNLELQMSDKTKISIPDNHKRSLSVTARHIESSIDDIEELLNHKRQNSLTEKVIMNLSQDKRDKILELTKIIREKNQMMFNDLKLNGNVFYEDRIIRSRVSHIWTLLCDSTAEALKGYGDVTPEQREMINKHVNSLLETINIIQSLII